MRLRACLLAFGLMITPAYADDTKSDGPQYEPQTYRFGGTYLRERSYGATGCAQVCGRDPFCKSWSFLQFEGNAGSGMCELKHTIGRSEANPTATSGISPALEARYSTGITTSGSELLGEIRPSTGRVRTVFAAPAAYHMANLRQPGVYLNGRRVPYTTVTQQQ